MVNLNKDTIAIAADTVVQADTIPVPKGDIETAIIYSAKDSIRMDVINKIVYLYGDSKIDYGEISLKAEYIEIDWSSSTLTAKPGTDSLGNKFGTPVFKDKDGEYEVHNYVKYNFKTKKGISSGVVTQQGEGYIHGEKVKSANDNLYISRAQYTTCNLAHPHFYINATKLKVIPDDKIVSGPFNLVISDVPTPLGFILGFFPMPKKEKSGVIIPTFGNSGRGFFLREGGYYWAAGQHLGVKMVGDVYANGSYRASTYANYIKRYKFSGNASFNYSKDKFGFEDNEDFQENINFTWNHSTLAKKNSNLSANVNIGSVNYYKRNSYDPTALQTGTFRSSITYNKIFANSPFTLNMALSQDQSVTTRIANYTFPDLSLAMNRIYPFRRKDATSGKRFYENINISYTLNTKATFTNDSNQVGTDTVLAFNQKNLPFLLSKGKYGAEHTIPISVTFKPTKTFLKYFNITPNFSYSEWWYPNKLEYQWENDTLTIDTVNTFARTYSYSGGASVNTTIYGMYKFNSKKLLGIRHTLIPTIGYSFMPDFTRGNYQNVQVDTLGRKEYRPTFNGFLFGQGSRGVSSSLNFGFTNTFEGKIASKSDTITGTKKIKLLERLSLNGSYNFAADSFNLSLIQLNIGTRVLNRFDINYNATFDPYIYNSRGIRINEFAINNKQGLAKLTNYNISVSANLNPQANPNSNKKKTDEASKEEIKQINANPGMYVDFNVPWNLYISYNLSYSKIGIAPSYLVQSLTFNGDIRLTDKWKIGFNSGYDMQLKTFTTTSLSVHRDLHCWEMSFNVIPFGLQQSYGFTINAKSSILQDLKLNKKSAGYFGGY